MNETINSLLASQLDDWETARQNYAALADVRVKELNVRGIPYKVQFNPARIISSGAKVDAKTIQERKCFLCPANLPPQQRSIPFEGHYNILVNPFPIFPRHLTIPEKEHVDQRIASRFADMLSLGNPFRATPSSITVPVAVPRLPTMRTSRRVAVASCPSRKIGAPRWRTR